MAKGRVMRQWSRRTGLHEDREQAGDHIVPYRDRQSSTRVTERTAWLVVAGVTVPILAWLILILVAEQARFAVWAPQAQVGVEAASALARLFGALVLFLFPADRGGNRLRWVAAGFVILGLGGAVFGYLASTLGFLQDQNAAMYASLMVRTLAGVLFLIGLLPSSSRPLTRRTMLAILALFTTLSILLLTGTRLLPPLILETNIEVAATLHDAPLSGLTPWHWALSSVPLVLAIGAVLGAVRRNSEGSLRLWLVVAMVLMAGSQLHSNFWPSVYSPVVATADILRLAFAGVVVVGAVIELRHIASERAALLAVEQENNRRLAELAVLRADFTAMVAHELGSPLAAIRGFTDILGTGEVRPEDQPQILAAIQAETNVLTTLVADVQNAARVERDDFAVQLEPVSVDILLADAQAFARTLPGNHPCTVNSDVREQIWADPDRVGQVLRNLLSNAAKYSPAGTPIEITASHSGAAVRISVTDHGPGIHPDDVTRIFEKFGRGRDQTGRKVPGVGLGLYLSRRIVQLHGSDLKLESGPGAGSTFSFELGILT